jgi:3-methyladenine DNA glycosylase AlkD
MWRAEATDDLRRALDALRDPHVAAHSARFFQTGPGGYGEGDRFLGIRVPDLRAVARAHRALPLEAVVEHLRSPWHEERLVALLILVEQHRRGSAEVRARIHRIYLEHTRFVNGWDLVDTTAEHLVGPHVDPTDPTLPMRLAGSDSVWERRIAMMATFHWTRKWVFEPALSIADRLQGDPHDLIQKSVGWMVREVGKRDPQRHEAFLAERYGRMPRTMLRYAIERLPEARRQAYLRGKV